MTSVTPPTSPQTSSALATGLGIAAGVGVTAGGAASLALLTKLGLAALSGSALALSGAGILLAGAVVGACVARLVARSRARVAEAQGASASSGSATDPSSSQNPTPPASTPPSSAPPASTPPSSTPPASTPPASTPPSSTPPARMPGLTPGRAVLSEAAFESTFRRAFAWTDAQKPEVKIQGTTLCWIADRLRGLRLSPLGVSFLLQRGKMAECGFGNQTQEWEQILRSAGVQMGRVVEGVEIESVLTQIEKGPSGQGLMVRYSLDLPRVLALVKEGDQVHLFDGRQGGWSIPLSGLGSFLASFGALFAQGERPDAMVSVQLR